MHLHLPGRIRLGWAGAGRRRCRAGGTSRGDGAGMLGVAGTVEPALDNLTVLGILEGRAVELG